nr:MAG TPA: protein of unknown function DUF4969 [Caudoviricetes sp.]
MRLFYMLTIAVLAGALMAGCSNEDSYPETHSVHDFEAENLIGLHRIDGHYKYWKKDQSHGVELESPSYYAEYRLNSEKVQVVLTKDQFYGLTAIYSDTETFRKYIAEHDIILIRRYNEYSLKYQR